MSNCNLYRKKVMLGVFSVVFWVDESKSLVKSKIGGHWRSILKCNLNIGGQNEGQMKLPT